MMIHERFRAIIWDEIPNAWNNAYKLLLYILL